MSPMTNETDYAIVQARLGVRLVVWSGSGTDVVISHTREEWPQALDNRRESHLNRARGIAAARIATEQAPLFAFYADEILRASLWPSHDNDPEEAADQLARIEQILASTLLNADAFRAAVEFEKATGRDCDIRLVRMFEQTLPSIALAAAEPGVLLEAARSMETRLSDSSLMLATLIREHHSAGPAAPRPEA
jgi:sugar/nucleoside kinase (ribokinase family)